MLRETINKMVEKGGIKKVAALTLLWSSFLTLLWWLLIIIMIVITAVSTQ